MADGEVKYNNKTVTTIRGLEARSIAKWEKEGWEFVSQAPATLLRTTLAFRKPKKPIPRPRPPPSPATPRWPAP